VEGLPPGVVEVAVVVAGRVVPMQCLVVREVGVLVLVLLSEIQVNSWA